ncbi:Signal transduction response regulator, receiver region domain protein [Rhodopirellula maiorica SM1]|uniref:Signal transduction response regulator, receiver region domain protein n=2 Tax=Novipirellula TaxID=2795426 RepID=M5RTH6_9BACT|nr:Signal transduction response regulator, receiver region domain protein [Rhodopirellula maiorica SM1]
MIAARSSGNQAEHRRRNQLNVVQLYLDAIQSRIDRGELFDVQTMIDTLVARLNNENREENENHEENRDHASPRQGNIRAAAVSEHDKSHPRTNQSNITDPRVRLLVVEDSDNERSLMTYLLASQGFVVHVARDGGEACERLQYWGTLPDVILMDMQMPMLGGLETLHRIRQNERTRDLLVYAITGSRRQTEDEPTGRGWDRWFAKPLDIKELVQAIHEDHAHHLALMGPPAAGGPQWYQS